MQQLTLWCPLSGKQKAAGQLATGPTSRMTGALPLSITHVAYTVPPVLPLCTLTVREPTCSAAGRETPGWLCRCDMRLQASYRCIPDHIAPMHPSWELEITCCTIGVAITLNGIVPGASWNTFYLSEPQFSDCSLSAGL